LIFITKKYKKKLCPKRQSFLISTNHYLLDFKGIKINFIESAYIKIAYVEELNLNIIFSAYIGFIIFSKNCELTKNENSPSYGT
jgi:hypothetical protein